MLAENVCDLIFTMCFVADGKNVYLLIWNLDKK